MGSSHEIPRYPLSKLVPWIIPLSKDYLNSSVRCIEEMKDIEEIVFTDMTSVVMVNHPDYVKHVLKEHEVYSRKRVLGNIRPLIGEGIFGSEGSLWEQQHKLIKPALHEKMMSEYFEIIQKETFELIEKWKKESRLNQSVYVDKDVNVLMLKVLIKTQFCKVDDVDYERIIELLNLFLKETGIKKYLWTTSKEYVYRKLSMRKSHEEKMIPALNELEQLLKELLEKARSQPEKKGLVLELLDNAKNEGVIGEKQVLDELKNFIFAGFDTTATVITWAIYCLSVEKKEAVSVYDEVDNKVLGAKTELPGTKRFLNEVMRLYPPVHTMARATQREDKIGEYTIPKDKWVAINIYALHRNKKFWKDPERFDSDRFLPEQLKGKAFTYIPFGQGRRACLGKALAMAELEYIFPILVKYFEFEYPESKPPKIVPDTIIKPKKPLMMHIRPR